MSVRISCDGVDEGIRQMQLALDSIGGKRAGKIIANAINQSLAAGRKEAAREARKAYTARIKKLFDHVKINRARAGNLDGELDLTSDKGVSLIHFRTNPKEPGKMPPEGVRAQIKKGGPNKLRVSKKNDSKKAFVMKKKQGGYGIFVNHGVKKKFYGAGKRKPRIIIRRTFNYEMLFGASPIQHLQRNEALEIVEKEIGEAFSPNLVKNIDKILNSL